MERATGDEDEGGRHFRTGDVFHRIISVPAGDVSVVAVVRVDGPVLVLEDFEVFPIGSRRLLLGAGVLFQARGTLAKLAADSGFDAVRIMGKRISGAQPGRDIDITLDVRRYR